MMDSNKKIDLINAYRQLVGFSLKLNKSTTEDISITVQNEFQEFVKSRIEELLNGKKIASNSTSQFSTEDTEILMSLIDNVKSKLRGGPQPVKKQTRQSSQYDQPAGQISNNDNDPNGEKLRNAQFQLLRSLEKMENEGPEF